MNDNFNNKNKQSVNLVNKPRGIGTIVLLPFKFLFLILLYPFVLLIWIFTKIRTTFSWLKRNFAKRREQKKLRFRYMTKETELYTDFSPKKSVQNKITFKEHYLVFKGNGLGTFESLYNAWGIVLLNKSIESNTRKSKKNYQNIFQHPLAWYENQAHVFKNSFWDFLLSVLAVFPKIRALFTSIPHKIRSASKKRRRYSSSQLLNLSLNYILPLVVFVFSVIWIRNILSNEIGFITYINGQPVGTVASLQVVENAQNKLEEEISNQLGYSYQYENAITYDFSYINPNTILDVGDCYDILDNIKQNSVVKAYALYVDGIFVAANYEKNVIEQVVDSLQGVIINQSSKNEIVLEVVNINNDIDIRQQYCDISTLKTFYEMKDLLDDNFENETLLSWDEALTQIEVLGTSNTSVVISLATNSNYFSSENAWKSSFSVTEYGPIRINDIEQPAYDVEYTYQTEAAIKNLVSQLQEHSETAKLNYKVTLTETVLETVPHTVLYEYSENYFSDVDIVKVQGIDGQKRLTYENTYVDGNLVERVLVGSETVVEMQSEIIMRGSSEVPGTIATGSFIWPAGNGKITSYFGGRELFGSYDRHRGIDIKTYYGAPIYASDGGYVAFSGERGSYGKYVMIDHGNGFKTVYAHCSELFVNTGERVYQGQLIAQIGMTGVTTGPHVHFEIQINNTCVNPLNYLPKYEDALS